MDEPKKLMLAGDWHGNLYWARLAIDHAARNGCDTILHLGDFGWWIDNAQTKAYLAGVQGRARRADITLYWLDGNHEDHSRIWDLNQPDIGGPFRISEHLPNVLFLPRGLRWKWWGKTWMAVGGAVSVDRSLRTAGVDWWPEETLTDDQIEYCGRPGKVDVIVSHDCPLGVDIPGLLPPGALPEWIIHEADIHRRKLLDIWNTTGATRLFHGHYHSRYHASVGDGIVVGLDRDNTTLDRNTLILTESDFEIGQPT